MLQPWSDPSKYSEEFRGRAVRLHLESDRPIAHVARGRACGSSLAGDCFSSVALARRAGCELPLRGPDATPLPIRRRDLYPD